MASPRKLLSTDSVFDDAVTVHAQDIVTALMLESDPDLDHTFYLYQDYTTSEIDETKEKIVTSVYNRNDLTGFDNALQRVHFIRSRCYKQMSDERTLRYK